jgi:hypothetical protein
MIIVGWLVLTLAQVAVSMATNGLALPDEVRVPATIVVLLALLVLGARPLLHWILEDGPASPVQTRTTSRAQRVTAFLFLVVTFVIWAIPMALLVPPGAPTWSLAAGAAFWIWYSAWVLLSGLLGRALLPGPEVTGSVRPDATPFADPVRRS